MSKKKPIGDKYVVGSRNIHGHVGIWVGFLLARNPNNWRAIMAMGGGAYHLIFPMANRGVGNDASAWLMKVR
jgi:hypothetical protein